MGGWSIFLKLTIRKSYSPNLWCNSLQYSRVTLVQHLSEALIVYFTLIPKIICFVTSWNPQTEVCNNLIWCFDAGMPKITRRRKSYLTVIEKHSSRRVCWSSASLQTAFWVLFCDEQIGVLSVCFKSVVT